MRVSRLLDCGGHAQATGVADTKIESLLDRFQAIGGSGDFARDGNWSGGTITVATTFIRFRASAKHG
jgi:acyl-CoA hydrolase